jgi:hypothetical protein
MKSVRLLCLVRFPTRFVRALRSIDASFGQPQPLDGLSLENVGVDDLRDILRLYAAIPNRFRVDHDRRAMLALVETPGFIRPDSGFQLANGEFFFEDELQRP